MLGVTLSKRARARSDPAAGVERGARPAPPVGPAVVAADATGARLRDRPARVRRPVRRLARRRDRARPSCVDAAQAELDDVLALGGAFEAVDELKAPAGRVDGRAHPAHRVRRAGRGRRQPRSPRPSRRRSAARARSCRSTRRSRPRRSPTCERLAGRRATQTAVAAALDELRRAAGRRRQRHAGRRSPWPRPAAPPASGARRCARCSASTGRPTGVGGGRRSPAASWPTVAERVQDDPRRAAAAARRQARPRRPLQRRRADRRRRPRRRHGGRLLRHPPRRPSRSRRRRATRTPT